MGPLYTKNVLCSFSVILTGQWESVSFWNVAPLVFKYFHFRPPWPATLLKTKICQTKHSVNGNNTRFLWWRLPSKKVGMGLWSGTDENLERQRYSTEATFAMRNIWKLVWTWVLGLEALFRAQSESLRPPKESQIWHLPTTLRPQWVTPSI